MIKNIFKTISKWFVEMVWPSIQELLKAVIVDFAKWIFDQLRDLFQKRNQRQEQYAKAKADEESKKAEDAKEASEAEMHRHMAEMWRQVADNFREENEKLKEDLEKLFRDATTKAKGNVQKLNVDDVFDLQEDKNVILKKVNILPQLEASKDPTQK